MQLCDTHCHIHSTDYPLDSLRVLKSSIEAGVTKMICVGQDIPDSEVAVAFAEKNSGAWSSIGIHPHEAKKFVNNDTALKEFAHLVKRPKVVAIGECGLDYFYNHSKKQDQVEILKFQLDLAQKNNLPLIFHVREAFDDFWPIFDEYSGLRGVIHSFTADKEVLAEILKRDLFVGLNGIMTFTKNADQLFAANSIPIDKLLLETDSPYLTPTPLRGKVCEPKYIKYTAEFLADQRGISLDEIAAKTSANADKLFNLL